MNQSYKRIWAGCVMDNLDQKMVLDERSIRDHSGKLYRNKLKDWHDYARGREKLEAVEAGIRVVAKNKIGQHLCLSWGLYIPDMRYFVVLANEVPYSQESGIY